MVSSRRRCIPLRSMCYKYMHGTWHYVEIWACSFRQYLGKKKHAVIFFLQFPSFQFKDSIMQRFKDWKEVLWINAPLSKIQRLKRSSLNQYPKINYAKIQRLKRSSLNQSPSPKVKDSIHLCSIFESLHLWIWGFDSKNFFSIFESLNLWIWGFDSKNFFSIFLNLWIFDLNLGLGFGFKELLVNLWICESLNVRSWFKELLFNLWIFESLHLVQKNAMFDCVIFA